MNPSGHSLPPDMLFVLHSTRKYVTVSVLVNVQPNIQTYLPVRF